MGPDHDARHAAGGQHQTAQGPRAACGGNAIARDEADSGEHRCRSAHGPIVSHLPNDRNPAVRPALRAGHRRPLSADEGGRRRPRQLGIDPAALSTTTPLRYDVEWTEQAHDLAGPLGAAITRRLFDLGMIERGVVPRSVVLIAED